MDKGVINMNLRTLNREAVPEMSNRLGIQGRRPWGKFWSPWVFGPLRVTVLAKSRCTVKAI